MQVDTETLSRLFLECSSPDVAKIKKAEAYLTEASAHPAFLSSLIVLIETPAVPDTVRQLAAIYFKNHVRKHWDAPESAGGLRQTDRQGVKSKIVGLVVQSVNTPSIHTQLASAAELVAVVDFPSEWKNLLPDLVQQYLMCSGGTLKERCAAMEVADIVLEKYRHASRSNEVLADLKFDILPHIQAPLLDIANEAVKQLMAAGPNASKTPDLDSWFRFAHLTTRVCLSLVSIDLPEFIEDHKEEFICNLVTLLRYQNVNYSGVGTDTEGPLEELKAEICRLLTAFVQRYCEEFEPFVVQLVAEILGLLLINDADASYLDGVASSAIKFLSTVARSKWTPCPFSDPPTRLSDICQHVILPNVQLRDSDIELMEDNPQEFIRRSLEDAETDTRRAATVDLVHSLSQCYEQQLNTYLPGYIGNLLSVAATKPPTSLDFQKSMDAAIYLVIALLVKSQSRAYGVAEIGSSVDLSQFFAQIANQLLIPDNVTNPGNDLVRSSTLKFIATFRNQLDKGVLLKLLPEIVRHLNLPSPVVYTHAAYCVETMMTARTLSSEPLSAMNGIALSVSQGPLNRGTLKFTKGELREPLFTALQAILLRIKSGARVCENEYLARCVMKVIGYLYDEAAPVTLRTLETLRDVLRIQCDNSSNPLFSHFLFESIAVSVKVGSRAGHHAAVEQILLETLSTIIMQPDHDFTPYALQIMGLLLDTAAVASPLYVNLLDHLLDAAQWSASWAKVPGIVRVLSAFFRKHEVFDACIRARFETIMLRFQYCLNHKRLWMTAFDLLSDALHYLPVDMFTPYFQPLVLTLLNRLQAANTPSLSRRVVLILSIFNCRGDATVLPRALNQIQPGLAVNFLAHVYVPTAKGFDTLYDKKLGLLGLARLCTTEEVMGDAGLLSAALAACAELMGIVNDACTARAKPIAEEPNVIASFDMAYGKTDEFQGAFNVLHAAKVGQSSKEIQEVAAPAFLAHVRLCFENATLAAKAVNVPAWGQMISLLSAASG